MITRTLPQAPAAGVDTRRIAATGHPNTLAILTRHLLQRYRRPGLFWALGLGIYTAIIVLAFPSVRDAGMFDIIEKYPAALREAFQINEMATVGNFLGVEVYSYAPLVLSFFTIFTFAGAIAGAEERGALDVLLGNPLPRWNLVLGTWIAVAAVLLGILLVQGAAGWLAAVAIGVDLSAREAFRGALNLFPITMAFGSLALLLSAWARQRGVALGIPIALLFLMYLIDVIGKISSRFSGLRVVSAFRYYDDAIRDGIPWGGVAVLLIAALILLALAIPAFDRRDIYT